LRWYLSRDLLKVTALALVALTLVMTVFAIIEPLRKEGLEATQTIALIGYTLPVMLSLTLPVAALFAATIVYGRFSQDNEMVACRASGISTMSVLSPAIVLGGAVTVLSLFLSNYVTPHMAAMGQKAVKANVRNIVYQKLHRSDIARPDDIRLVAAPAAYIYFDEYESDWYATVELIRPTIGRTSSGDILQETVQPLQSMQLPDLTEEQPSWYDWGRLRSTLANPTRNREIGRVVSKIRDRIRHEMLARDIVETINSGRPYGKLSSGRESYRISAASAVMSDDGRAVLSAGEVKGVERRVEVKIIRDGLPFRTFTALRGAVEGIVSPRSNKSFAGIELRDDVRMVWPADADVSPRRQRWSVGQLAIPADIVERADSVSEEDIYSEQPIIRSPGMDKVIRSLKTNYIPKLLGKIQAEMHGRVAYSLSCFLLVSMGAALGLIFRGGQFISAFALSAAPAAAVIVMVVMGKQLLANPKVGESLYGILCIWSGIVALVAANTVIYAHLARK